MSTDCVGRCNSKARREQNEYKLRLAAWDEAMAHRQESEPEPSRPVPPDIRPYPGNPVWCLRCQGIIRIELAELDDLAALVAAIPPLARAADDGAGKVGGTRDRKSPSPRMDDLEDLDGWLRSWEAAARHEDDPRPRRGYLARESTTLTAWLYHHFDELILNPLSAEDFGSEVQMWHRNLARRAAAGKLNRHQKKPCPRCHLYTLWLTMGEDFIRCVNEDCTRMLSRQEYDTLEDAA